MSDGTGGAVPLTPTRGVPLVFGTQEFRLRYSFARQRAVVEALHAQTFQDVVGSLAEHMERLPLLVWHGIGGPSSGVTVADLEDWMDLENIAQVMEAVVAAVGGKRVAEGGVPLAPVPPPQADVAAE